ncbi:MAG: SDR family NAD(P)-dependent oxidoreductase [Candidatus Dormibacteraeota bacterium]|jgi:NAD(P)-dependent dehydrogenase (short-subunit alcohol dehydrogenase family)|nr:SDR family NAD(P)-dependent oxidoreductase [Candidatus Dormibacteraeota bacterium]
MGLHDIRGQWCFLSGAADGLGNAIARELAARGMNLVLFDVQEGKVASLAHELLALGIQALPVGADLADAAGAQTAVAQAVRQVGAPRALIHDAAVLTPRPFREWTFEGWRRELDIILQGAFVLAKGVWEPMIAQGHGSIVFISSGSALRGFPLESAYTPAKHGQEGLMKVLSIEGAEFNIAVNTATTGAPIDTPMSWGHYTPEMRARMISPSRLAPAFAYLAALDAEQATGLRFDAFQVSEAISLRTQAARA